MYEAGIRSVELIYKASKMGGVYVYYISLRVDIKERLRGFHVHMSELFHLKLF